MIRFKVFKFPPGHGNGPYEWCTQDYFYCNLLFSKTWEEAMETAEVLGRMYANQ